MAIWQHPSSWVSWRSEARSPLTRPVAKAKAKAKVEAKARLKAKEGNKDMELVKTQVFLHSSSLLTQLLLTACNLFL